MIKESLKVLGALELVVRDVNGNITKQVLVPNTVVNSGKAFIAQSMLKTQRHNWLVVIVPIGEFGHL